MICDFKFSPKAFKAKTFFDLYTIVTNNYRHFERYC